MNFQPNRVDPIQFAGEEPTDFGEYEAARKNPFPQPTPHRSTHVSTASREDEVPVSWLTYALAVVGFFSIVLALGLSVGYWFRLF